jgi:hypothetical protein
MKELKDNHWYLVLKLFDITKQIPKVEVKGRGNGANKGRGKFTVTGAIKVATRVASKARDDFYVLYHELWSDFL